MAEAKQIIFRHTELAEMMVKQQDIHEGLWSIYLKFGIQGANLGPTPEDILPAAIVPVLEIGIQRVNKANRLTVDAAIVNPAPGKMKD